MVLDTRKIYIDAVIVEKRKAITANVLGLCVVALSKNLKLTTTHSWAITQNPCYVPLNFTK